MMSKGRQKHQIIKIKGAKWIGGLKMDRMKKWERVGTQQLECHKDNMAKDMWK